MIRQISAISLAVSFLAMATSGVMMLVVEQPSFTIQMHPVHKIFGIVLIIAALTHISLHSRSLLNHLKNKISSVYAGILVVMLVLMYGVAINNTVPEELAIQMNNAAEQVENNH